MLLHWVRMSNWIELDIQHTIYTLKTKLETFKYFKTYHAHAEKHTGSRIKTLNVVQRSPKPAEQIEAIRIDNGAEYISNEFKSYLLENGIQHQRMVAYTPQQTGVVERMNRTLMDCVRSLLHSSELDKSSGLKLCQLRSTFVIESCLDRSP